MKRESSSSVCWWSCLSVLSTIVSICPMAYAQMASVTTVLSSSNSFRNGSSNPIATPPPSSCKCVVFAGSQDRYWAALESKIVATVYETVYIQQNSTVTATNTVYNSVYDGGNGYITNGTGTISEAGYTFVYPTHYIWIDTVIIDKCIDPKVNPNDLLTDQIAFPYMGITTSAYVTPVPTDDSSGYASFFSLIGAPSDCTLVPTGAPYALQPVTALTATSTITPSILPGQNPSDRPTNVVPTGPFWLAPVTGGFSLITTSSQRIEAPSPTPPKEPLHPEPAITTTPIPALSPTPPREPLHPAPAVTNTPVPPLSPQQPVDGPVTQPDNGGTRPVLPDITIGGSIVSPNTAGAYVVASQTLKPGGQITVSGTPISLVPSATAIVVAGITQPVHPAVQPSPAVVTINGFPVTPNAASQYVVGTQTVMPGAPAVTISGTPYSIAPLPSYTVVGGTTHQGTVVGGTTYQQTVVGGTTYQLPPAPPNLPTPTIGGTIVTPNGAGAYIVASQTLVPGGSAITVSGTRYSLASGDSYLVVGSVTETFASQTTASGLGGYIISGLGASPTAAGGGGRTNITMFTGGTSSLSRSRKAVAAGVVVVGGFAMVW